MGFQRHHFLPHRIKKRAQWNIIFPDTAIRGQKKITAERCFIVGGNYSLLLTVLSQLHSSDLMSALS